ncbi:HEAT repeat domain-containing protein [Psychrobacter sp. FDAARGOS_221]|nr:HEAT repeat domain-containing protein [Psychrobacter sp. FDAARGOS_221]
MILTPLLCTSMLCSISSHANTDNTRALHITPEPAVVAQCHAQHQAPTLPIIKRSQPLVVNKEHAEGLEKGHRFAQKYILSTDPTDPPHRFYFGSDDEFVALLGTDSFSLEEATHFLSGLYRAYITGEYIPRDDDEAIIYLSRVIDYWELENPGNISGLAYLVAVYSLTDSDDFALLEGNDAVLSDTDASFDDELEKSLFAILAKAGSKDAQAVLIKEMLKDSDPTCREVLISDLIALADKGSPKAIDILADTYEALNNEYPNQYEKQMDYWQQQAKKFPVVNNTTRI